MPHIQFASVDELLLDHKNPRLGREVIQKNLDQDALLKEMKDWSLEELAVSFLETGFWYQEPLVVVEEQSGKSKEKIVVEGNRRLAALKLLKAAFDGDAIGPAWKLMVAGKREPKDLFAKLPFVIAESRSEVASFIGFRHVTGIKEWRPSEKAEFIVYLVDNFGLTYDQVRRRIGSKTDTVRRNYIAYHILLQMEGVAGIDIGKVENRFSILFLSLRTEGVQKYLNLNLEATPPRAKRPVAKAYLDNLKHFSAWLFGTDEVAPIFTDSRRIEEFGRVLLSKRAVDYLLRDKRPNLDTAIDLAGADAPDVIERLENARDNIQFSLGRAHLYKRDPKLKAAVGEIGQHVARLLDLYPDLKAEIVGIMTED